VVDRPSTRLRLRVSPGASRSEIVGRHGAAWKVRVAAPPESGKANDALLDLLAATFEIPRARIALVRGRASRDKTVVLEGLSPEDVEARLASPAGAAT
jgi:uncharacterized protein (TIGR00251 family)